MPDFQPHTLDLTVCRQQVQELKALLDSSADLGEAVFHDFFEPRVHLRAMIGRWNSALLSPDRLAWQYPIFGDFRCDFAVGDWGWGSREMSRTRSASARQSKHQGRRISIF